MEREAIDNPENRKTVPTLPAQHGSPVWEKSDRDEIESGPKSPLWTRYMDSRLKEFCKR